MRLNRFLKGRSRFCQVPELEKTESSSRSSRVAGGDQKLCSRFELDCVPHFLTSAIGFVLLLGFGTTQPTPAATISFNPSLGIAQSYTSNVLFTSEDEISDTYTTVGLTLPVTRTTKKSETQFIYRPSYQIYNSSDQLDNLSHQLSLLVASQPGRAAQIDFNLRYYYGQGQGSADSTDGSDLVVIPRNTREQGTIGLSIGNRIAGRWRWGATAQYETLSYSQISDDTGNPGPVLPQDRTSIGAIGLITYGLSSLSSAGIEVGVSQFDLDHYRYRGCPGAHLCLSEDRNSKQHLQLEYWRVSNFARSDNPSAARDQPHPDRGSRWLLIQPRASELRIRNQRLSQTDLWLRSFRDKYGHLSGGILQ